MIELQNVVLAYEDRTILDHVDLTIHDGETLAILQRLVKRNLTDYGKRWVWSFNILPSLTP